MFSDTDDTRYDPLAASLATDAAAARIARRGDVTCKSLWTAMDIKPSVNVVLAALAAYRRKNIAVSLELACAVLAISKKGEDAYRLRSELALAKTPPNDKLTSDLLDAARKNLRDTPKPVLSLIVEVFVSTSADRVLSMSSVLDAIVDQFTKTRVTIVASENHNPRELRHYRNVIKCKYGENVNVVGTTEKASPLTSLLTALQSENDAVIIIEDKSVCPPEMTECLISAFVSSPKVFGIKQVERYEFDPKRSVRILRHLCGVIYPVRLLRSHVDDLKRDMTNLPPNPSFDYVAANFCARHGVESDVASSVLFSGSMVNTPACDVYSLAETKAHLKTNGDLDDKLDCKN